MSENRDLLAELQASVDRAREARDTQRGRHHPPTADHRGDPLSTDARTWVARGTTVIGTAPGHDDITIRPTRRPKDAATVDLIRKVAIEMARTLNGEPPLSDVDKTVMEATIDHQRVSPYPARIGQIADATGLHRMTVHTSWDRLAGAGYGTRPPAGVGQRPFTAHMPEQDRPVR